MFNVKNFISLVFFLKKKKKINFYFSMNYNKNFLTLTHGSPNNFTPSYPPSSLDLNFSPKSKSTFFLYWMRFIIH